MKQIVYNSVKCLECNETIVSYHRHDYKTCGCPNEAMVDGGTAYLRYGAKNMRKIELITVYADEDYQLVRNYATRGSRGVDGNQPLKWIPLCDMEDDHLEACLDYGGADWHMELIRKEIAYRKFKEHQKESIIELMNMDSYEPKGCAEMKNDPWHVKLRRWWRFKKWVWMCHTRFIWDLSYERNIFRKLNKSE